jgi:type II secretory pathway pseudopilin PulG
MTGLTTSRGYSLLELMMVAALGVTLSASAVPGYLSALDDVRTSGAAHHLSARLQRARMEAVRRSAMVGLQFTQAPDGRYGYATYVDGNRNGVLTDDIQHGIDRLITAIERLPDQFSGVDFGANPALPAVDAGGKPPGADPKSSTSRKLHELGILTMPYLTNLAAISKPRVTLIALPLKMKNVEASPIRAVAIED